MISLIAYAKADIRASLSALNDVENKVFDVDSKALKGLAAYHAQQAIEKIIKSEIYRKNPNINPRKTYTHNLYDLCSIAKSLNIKIPADIRKNSIMYTEWEASGRYDIHFVVRVDSIKRAIKTATYWINEIEKRK